MENQTTLKSPNINWDIFEYIIAFNVTSNEIYTASIIDQLDTSYLKNKNIQKYIDIIFNFYRKHSILPNTTEIKSYLTDDKLKESYIDVTNNFINMSEKFNEDELYKNTEQFIKERAVFNTIQEIVNFTTKTGTLPNPNEVLQDFEKACNITLIDNVGHDYFYEIDKHIYDITQIDSYISTGYKWLDKVLGGGVVEAGRAIYTFSGATNSGKSIVLGNIASNIVKQNRTVVLITLEMSETIYGKRISSQLSRIAFKNLKSETDQLKEYLQTFLKEHSGARLIIKEFPPACVTPNQLKAYVKKLMSKKRIKPDVIIIDYLTLMIANNMIGNMYADGKALAEQIRALSYPFHFGCPIISALQLNRLAYEKTNPGLETTGESIGIPQTGDAQFSIWSSDSDQELGLINIGIQKNRFGPNFGVQAFKIDYNTLAIDESGDVFNSTDEIQKTSNLLDKLTN